MIKFNAPNLSELELQKTVVGQFREAFVVEPKVSISTCLRRKVGKANVRVVTLLNCCLICILNLFKVCPAFQLVTDNFVQ